MARVDHEGDLVEEVDFVLVEHPRRLRIHSQDSERAFAMPDQHRQAAGDAVIEEQFRTVVTLFQAEVLDRDRILGQKASDGRRVSWDVPGRLLEETPRPADPGPRKERFAILQEFENQAVVHVQRLGHALRHFFQELPKIVAGQSPLALPNHDGLLLGPGIPLLFGTLDGGQVRAPVR